MSDEQLFLTLGCFGLREDDFVSCAGCENVILRPDQHLAYYNEMMNYFDQCRLFDRPMFDLNSIRHLIFNLQDRFDQPTKKLWTEKKFQVYQKFIIDHRHCGLYIKLVLTTLEAIGKPPEPKGILIPAEKDSEPVEPTKLRIVRGTRGK